MTSGLGYGPCIPVWTTAVVQHLSKTHVEGILDHTRELPVKAIVPKLQSVSENVWCAGDR